MATVSENTTLKNYINGKFVETKQYLDTFDPSTGCAYARVPDSDGDDVNEAVNAARAAFKTWSVTPYQERARILQKIADLLENQADVFARAESRDQGKPIGLSSTLDIPRAIYNFRFFAGACLYQLDRASYLDGAGAVNYVSRIPIGVAGLISPWNLPLYLLTFKIAPAIIHGNTVVCKPSEMTSVTAYMLCEIFNQAGLPPGVVNMVFGTGPKTGEALVRHPDVRVISFTGSTATGENIRQATVPFCKKLSLELGGKNAAIIFDDADVDKCVQTTARSSFLNQGEICLCTSRIFVHANIYDKFLEKFVAETRSIKVGNPQDSSTNMGPLISKEHLAKVRKYVEIARLEGATILCGEGKDALDLPFNNKEGYFMAPTIITNVAQDSRCMLEEIFGPVTCVVPFNDESSVVSAANSVQYGLCAVIWSKDVSRIHRISRQLKVGTVWTNCWLLRDLRMPFGGVKESGLGREGMDESIEFYTEMQTLCIKI